MHFRFWVKVGFFDSDNVILGDMAIATCAVENRTVANITTRGRGIFWEIGVYAGGSTKPPQAAGLISFLNKYTLKVYEEPKKELRPLFQHRQSRGNFPERCANLNAGDAVFNALDRLASDLYAHFQLVVAAFD